MVPCRPSCELPCCGVNNTIHFVLAELVLELDWTRLVMDLWCLVNSSIQQNEDKQMVSTHRSLTQWADPGLRSFSSDKEPFRFWPVRIRLVLWNRFQSMVCDDSHSKGWRTHSAKCAMCTRSIMKWVSLCKSWSRSPLSYDQSAGLVYCS